MTTSLPSHKNKTTATLLAALSGCCGIHRFYLRGYHDKAAWLHLLSVPVSLLLHRMYPGAPLLFTLMPLVTSALIGALAALVMGTTPDDKWDAQYNPLSQKQSVSTWPLALILVLVLAIGAGSLIAVIARSFDLFFTGGAYG